MKPSVFFPAIVFSGLLIITPLIPKLNVAAQEPESATQGSIKVDEVSPSPIFRPILRNIQSQLPRGMVMRLPTYIQFIDINGNIRTLYSQLLPYNNELRISIVFEPNCQGNYCQIGTISTSQLNSNNYIREIRSQGETIDLGSGISGVYVQVNRNGLSNRSHGLVIWDQDNQTYTVSIGNDRQRNIAVARSMVSQPPIGSSR